MADSTQDRQALAEAVLETAEREQVRFVNLQFSDIIGHVKSVALPIHQLRDSIEYGTWFDGSSIEGFTRIHESDMFLEPDLTTFQVPPFERGANTTTARIICNIYSRTVSPFPGDPRGS